MFENNLNRDLLDAELEYRLARARHELADRRQRRVLTRGRRVRRAGAAEPR